MLLFSLSLAALVPALQTCHEPTAGFGAYGVAWGPNGGHVAAMAVFDDGNGPALYLGGTFNVAGEEQVDSIVRFDGVSWQELPGPGGASVVAGYGYGIIEFEVYDDGNGDALYVSGSFETALGLPAFGIARWDGVAWSSVLSVTTQFANYPAVADMQVWDDGSGPALFFCGQFNKVDGLPAGGAGKYTGAGWTTLGGGFTGTGPNCIVPHDDGSGERLFFGGWNFPSMRNVQTWDGTSWTILSDVFDSDVESLFVHDPGTGPLLYAGGAFTTPAVRVASWNGATWSAVGAGVDFFPTAFATFDDGSGSKLYAVGGSFAIPPPGWDIRAARWDGTSWEYLGSGLNNDALAAVVFDDGGGPALYVGGAFVQAGGKRADHVARWTSTGWSRAYSSKGLIGPAHDFCVFDDGSGEKLYSTGGLIYPDSSADTYMDSVVRYGPGGWTQIGGLADGGVESLAVFDDGGGDSLFAGGWFETIDGTAASGIARWDGTQWLSLGTGLTTSAGFVGGANAMQVHDFGAGPRLVVAGDFDFAGGVAARNVAVWDGASWSSLGIGIDGPVYALAVFDDGVNGPWVYAGGDFLTANGVPVNHIARWDGSNWAPFLGGMNREVYALATLTVNGGSGLFAGGEFFNAGGVIASKVARFDGTSWHPLHVSGVGLDQDVRTITSYDEGRGPELIVGGGSAGTGALPGESLARWDGAAWNAFSKSPNGQIRALLAYDDGGGSGPALFMGGDFDSCGDEVSLCVARWAPTCPCPPVVYCTAKVNSQGCAPSMYASGTTSLADNNLRLHADFVLNNKNGLLFWSLKPAALPFQGGYLCCKPPIVRTPVQSSAGNPPPNDCSGSLHFHWNQAYVAQEGLSLGEWYYTQYWSRDPADPATTSLSDALRFLLCP